MSAKQVIESVETDARLPGGTCDRFSGYAVIGVPFRSGHVLALRRFPKSSIGPGYTAVWHRDQSGRWTFYSTVPPEASCARYFGGEVDRNVVTSIGISWLDAVSFEVSVGAAIRWRVTLATALAPRLLSAVAAAIPDRMWNSPAVVDLVGRVATAMLGTGRLRLTVQTTNGYRFTGSPRRVWLIHSSDAVVDGVNLGPVGPLAQQASLGHFLLPQKGLFAVARACFERVPSRSTLAGHRTAAIDCPAAAAGGGVREMPSESRLQGAADWNNSNTAVSGSVEFVHGATQEGGP